jgi:hypothetical protein
LCHTFALFYKYITLLSVVYSELNIFEGVNLRGSPLREPHDPEDTTTEGKAIERERERERMGGCNERRYI